MTSALSRLPLELITLIVQYLPTNEVFRLRHVIPEFRSDAVLEQALANDATHRSQDSAHHHSKGRSVREREALYKHHQLGFPCRKVIESRHLKTWSDLAGSHHDLQFCHGSSVVTIVGALEAEMCAVAVYDLLTNSTSIIELTDAYMVAMSTTHLVITNLTEVFVIPCSKLKPGFTNEAEMRQDPATWYKNCADGDSDRLTIRYAAAIDNYVAIITGKVVERTGPKHIHIYDGTQCITFEVPNWYEDIVIPNRPSEAIEADHHLLFDKGLLWHICKTSRTLSKDECIVKLTFQGFSLTGKLLHQWQYDHKMKSPVPQFQTILSTHTGRSSWLLAITNQRLHMNFVVDFSSQSIVRYDDGPYTIWKDRVYRIADNDHKNIDVLRSADWSKVGRLTLNIRNIYKSRLIVNDSFLVFCDESIDDGAPYAVWRWTAFTFDESLAPVGERLAIQMPTDKRMFWQPFDAEAPYIDPLNDFESSAEEMIGKMERIELIENAADGHESRTA